MRAIVFLLLLCFLPAPDLCLAQVTQGKVEAPAVAKRDRPIRINHPEGAKVQAIFASVQNGVVVWSYLPDDHFERTPTFTVFVAPPGDFLVTIGDSAIVKIVEEGRPDPIPGPGPRPQPDPGPPDPQPQPDPGPAPDPKLKINWAVWVYEQADAVDEIAQTNTRLSIETRRFLDGRNIKIAAYDDEQDAARNFLKIADKLPALVFVQDAKTYSVHPAPSSVAELQALVKEVSGE